MYLHFDYNMEIHYSLPVDVCHYTIKCIPKDDARQRLVNKSIIMQPYSVYSTGKDSYGNVKIYGCIRQPHDYFKFNISGDVEILKSGYEELADERMTGIYRYPFGKCIPGGELTKYYNSLDVNGQNSDDEKCIYLMNSLYNRFHYVRDITGTETTAEEAFTMGEGVCQDYAHILITLIRMAGIPARYVCGMLVGEGASHAWVEALCDGRWVGFDPTNNCMVSNSHIKLSDGRDATECAINRGIMIGGGIQTQDISVSVYSY
ncbi:MAG: transglutaminase domain-containing protein [Lachnospira sp.]